MTTPTPNKERTGENVRTSQRSRAEGTFSKPETIVSPAIIDDLFEKLFEFENKAEIINGRIVHFMPTEGLPGRLGDRIFLSLSLYVTVNELPGEVICDNKAFRVNLPNRQSFSPDACYYVGDEPTMQFYDGAPQFAVEVRSENDYGLAQENDMRDKRSDYFAAGTLAVWDVDLLNEPIVRLYLNGDADKAAATFQRGDVAHAGDAVPGWTMPVENLFTKRPVLSLPGSSTPFAGQNE